MTNTLFRCSEVARTNHTMQLEHKQKKKHYTEKFPRCHASIIDSTKVKV